MIRKSFSRAMLVLALTATTGFAEFMNCRFNVGVDLKQASTKKCGYLGCTSDVKSLDIPSNPDFVAEYVGVNYASASQLLACGPSSSQEGLFLGWAKTLNSTPLWYTYIIAGDMKFRLGLDPQKSDCNQGGSKTICSEWGTYYASNRANIINNYKTYAQFAASNFGSSAKMIWALEPDFYQYASNQNGNSKPLSFSDASKLISEIIDAIKTAMPNALIAMDISAWAPDNWFTSMPLAKIDYFHVSGGTSQPGTQIQSANPLTWAHLYSLVGKPLIGDDGYGVGGGATSMNPNWFNTSNVQSRMNEGVIGVMEASPNSSLSSSITALHALKWNGTCSPGTPNTPSKFTLTLNAGTGGSASSNPSGSSFDSGTTVKLIATASKSYRFSGWTGDATGTKDTLTVVMNAKKTVTANFSQIRKFDLAIVLAQGGSVTTNPSGTSFDSGTVVGLKAKPYNGYSFSSWSGDLSGKLDTMTLTMNSSKSVVAAFQQNTAVKISRGISAWARIDGDRLIVRAAQAGEAEYAIVSPEGRQVLALGRFQTAGQELSIQLGAPLSGLAFLRIRDASGIRIVPVVDLGR